MSEQRRHSRVISRQRCWCEADDITIYGKIENLSEGGLFLRVAAPLANGALVQVRLGSGDSEVCARAAVVWHRGPAGPDERPGVGLCFERLDREAAEALRGHMDRLQQSGA